MMKRTGLSFLLAGGIALSPINFLGLETKAEVATEQHSPQTISTTGYSDVTPGNWYSVYVDYVVEKGYIQGIGDKFSPLALSSRETVALALAKLSGQPLPTQLPSGYVDVTYDSPFSSGIAWCLEAGVMQGYSQEYFGANQNLTREEFATALFSFAQRTGGNTQIAPGDLSQYPDYQLISSWAQAPLAWAVGAGLISGSDAGLNPKGTITRAEVAVILTAYDFFRQGLNHKEDLTPYYTEPEVQEVYGEVVGTASLRIRSEPSTSSSIVSTLIQGTQMQLTGYTSDGWFKIAHGESVGYMSAAYIQVIQGSKDQLPLVYSPQNGYISGPLTIYQGPGTSYEPVFQYTEPTVVKVSATMGEWYQLENGFAPTNQVEIVTGSRYRAVWAEVNRPKELKSGAELGQQIADYALCFVGYPYKADHSDTDGYDCAGLAKYVYGAFGFELEHSVRSIYLQGETVEKAHIQPGDLLIFGTISHVGIYVGDNKFVHASTPTAGVIISDLGSSYYVKNYVTAKRLV